MPVEKIVLNASPLILLCNGESLPRRAGLTTGRGREGLSALTNHIWPAALPNCGRDRDRVRLVFLSSVPGP